MSNCVVANISEFEICDSSKDSNKINEDEKDKFLKGKNR